MPAPPARAAAAAVALLVVSLTTCRPWLVAAAPATPPWQHYAAVPNSTLLPSGTTVLQLNVSTFDTAGAPRQLTSTPVSTQCRFGMGANAAGLPWAQLAPFTGRGGASNDTQHTTLLTGLSADPNTLNTVIVRCAAWLQDPPLVLVYRAISSDAVAPHTSSLNSSFPRTGNLWGSFNFLQPDGSVDMATAGRIDLWLGTGFGVDQVAQLRRAKPSVLQLTSTNAVEYGDGLPEHFYLHNISGQTKKDRLQTWTNSWRLDMTDPEVALWKASRMHELIVYGGWEGTPTGHNQTIPYDGMFVDNVFLTQSWAKTDMFGRPFYPDTNGDGKPDDPKKFDAAWRKGVLLELDTFRELVPAAVMSGHAMDPGDPGIAAVFNAISIGFRMPNVIEGVNTFDSAWTAYAQWFGDDPTLGGPKPPHATMMESAIPLQLGYGYGFGNSVQKNMPPSTWNFSRSYYPYMRFGLAFTLMRDGYFTHEVGDSAHGQNWWYDELDHVLGAATSDPQFVSAPSSRVDLTNPHSDWHVWADAAHGVAVNLTWDPSDTPPVTPPSAASARVLVSAVEKPTPSAGSAILEHSGINVTLNKRYLVSFWAKADVPTAEGVGNAAPQIAAAMSRQGPDWASYGLNTQVTLSPTWSQYNVTFTMTPSDHSAGPHFNDGRLYFTVGAVGAGTTVWVDTVSIVEHPPVVMREYECGLAVLNGDNSTHTVSVGGGYHRLQGSQAPLYQYIVDDDSQAFQPASGSQWAYASMDSGYDMAHPSSEVATGPYYHHWARGCHTASEAGAAATWDLRIPASGTYNVSAWWANATDSTSWSKATRHTVFNAAGKLVADASVTQVLNGDQWHLVATNVQLDNGSRLRVECASSSLCVTDAVLVESSARYNDGSAASAVTLAPFDGIVLSRDGTACHK